MRLAPYAERYNSYILALKDYGLSETSAVSSSPVHSMDNGYQCTLDLLEQNPHLDGIMAAVDAQGIGALRALKDKGIKVPDQIRVISLTGHIIGNMLETSITSMEMPAREMGMKAAQMTIEEIESPSDQKPSPQHLVFSSSLVERESC